MSVSKKPREKGQSAIEFMVYFSILMIILIAVIYSNQSSVIKINENLREDGINGMLEDIGSKFDMAYTGGDGFFVNVTVPEMVSGSEYIINVSNGFIFVNVSGDIFSRKILTDNISGTLHKGKNMLENNNGMIVIS